MTEQNLEGKASQKPRINGWEATIPDFFELEDGEFNLMSEDDVLEIPGKEPELVVKVTSRKKLPRTERRSRHYIRTLRALSETHFQLCDYRSIGDFYIFECYRTTDVFPTAEDNPTLLMGYQRRLKEAGL